MENNITLADFQKILEDHDWYYEMSHDRRVFERGYDSEKRILQLVKGNVFFEDMYNNKKQELNEKLQ
jgi:hypothetical protein